MSFFPPGFMPEGYFPEGYFPGDDTQPATPGVYVPPHRTVRIARAGPKALRWPAGKTPAEPSRYRLDFTEEVELRWTRRIYSVGERISVGGYDGHCLVAGLPGWREPRWPRVLDATLQDGSCTWKIVAPSSASLVTVSTIEWEVPEGITVESQLDGPLSTSAVLLGGEAGQPVTVLVKVRYENDEGFDQPCILHVE